MKNGLNNNYKERVDKYIRYFTPLGFNIIICKANCSGGCCVDRRLFMFMISKNFGFGLCLK